MTFLVSCAKVSIYALTILLPRHFVDSGSRLRVKRQIGGVQSFDIDVVQQISETQKRCFAVSRTLLSPIDAASCPCVPVAVV